MPISRMICSIVVLFCLYSDALSATLIFSDDFEDGDLSGWTVSSGVSNTTDDSYGGVRSIAINFASPNDRNQYAVVDLSAEDEWYIKFNVKLSSSWPGSQSVKWLRARQTAINLQSEFYLSSSACSGNMAFHTYEDGVFTNGTETMSNVFPSSGSWGKIEVYMKANTTSGSYDGIIRIWLNDVKIYEDISWRMWSSNYRYNRFFFPSNMNCDASHTADCCGESTDRAGATIYYDNIEIWDGMPEQSSTPTASGIVPTGLRVNQ